MSMVRGLQISAAKGGSTLTADQKRFNTLIRQIEAARDKLAAWHEGIPLYAQARQKTLEPLAEELNAERRSWALALDRLYEDKTLTKAERKTLRQLVIREVGDLLDLLDGEDDELKAVFDRHSDMDYDSEQALGREAMKEMAEAMTGLDLGDVDDIDSEDELLARVQRGMEAQRLADEAQQSTAQARRPKKQTAAQQRRETQAKAEAQAVTQSVREVFRKLASALHPDRETDPAEHAAKTALMQRVNQAYAANDLLALLELQLEVEQVDAGHIAQASPQRVKHYNKVLKEQLEELKEETLQVELGFRLQFGMEPGWGLEPKNLMRVLDDSTLYLRSQLATLRRNQGLLADRGKVKQWLKEEKQRLREEEQEDPFGDLF